MTLLSPRRTRLALDLLTGLVVISVAFALAGLTWRLAGHAGTGAITVPSGRHPVAVGGDLAPVLALSPFGKSGAAGEAGQPTSLPLELKGIILASPASLSTAFISVSGAPPTAFAIGAAVSTGTVQAILRDRVLISNGGRTEYLAFPNPGAVASPAGGPPPATAPADMSPGHGPPPGVPPAPPGQGSATQNTAAILARLDASPAEGGYRIGDNAPVGLQPGDLLQSINGAMLTDQASAEAAIGAARNSGTAQIQILRDGKRLTLTVPLR